MIYEQMVDSFTWICFGIIITGQWGLELYCKLTENKDAILGVEE